MSEEKEQQKEVVENIEVKEENLKTEEVKENIVDEFPNYYVWHKKHAND